MQMSAERAFAAYEAVRHRLPTAQDKKPSSRQVPTLAAIADHFDVFLLDAFGVLNIGDSAIPGTRDRIAGLRAAGKRVLVVSNAASVPGSDLLAKYTRMGFDFSLDDIITSRLTMAAELPMQPDLRWGVMNGAGSSLDDLGPVRTTPLDDNPVAYRDAEGFLLIGSSGWTEARQAMLEASLEQNPRRVLVANPDIVAPRETGFSIEPGFFAHRLADSVGIRPEFFGKPFGTIFDIALSRAEAVNKARVVMVGDSLHTDVLGAHCAGVASALIAGYGFFAGQDVTQAVRSSGIVPDYIVERP